MHIYIRIYIYTKTGNDARVCRLLPQNMQGTHAARMLTRMFFLFFLYFSFSPLQAAAADHAGHTRQQRRQTGEGLLPL
jgi:hypothetical protein